jgi:pimeloyl-ACP methyl ester carboxylesterase
MKMLQRLVSLAIAMAFTTVLYAADDTTSSTKPVKAVASQTIEVKTAKGSGMLPLYLSADWSKKQPAVDRVLIVFHGKLRDADVYNESGLKAIRAAGAAGKNTLLITPQFLAQVDVDTFHLPLNTLRWAPEAWMGGEDSINSGISSFDCIDAILARLSNKAIFPNLKTVIIAGHSGGGQVVQRYAVVGRGGDGLEAAGLHVRYVVANPSSYLYFSPDRPVLDAVGSFSFAAPRKSCNGHYDNWKYGVHNPPPYLGEADFGALETRYTHRNVVMLLGTKDTDPDHPALDKTCSGEDEGPYRFFRGKAYFAYMLGRHPELAETKASQQLWFVPGVEHDGEKMFNSPCGLAALFDSGVCATRSVAPTP